MKSGIWILTYSKQLIKFLTARYPHGAQILIWEIEILRSKYVLGVWGSLLRLHFRHGSAETNQTEIWHPQLSGNTKYRFTFSLQSSGILISQYQSIYYSLQGRKLWSDLLPGTAVQPVLIPACTITSLSKVITFWASCQDMHEVFKQ